MKLPRTIVFDNLVDTTMDPIGEPVQAEVSDEPVAYVKSPLGLFPNRSLDEIGEEARETGRRFLAMFG